MERSINSSKQDVKLIYKKKLNFKEIRNLWLQRIALWVIIVIVLFPIVTVISASMAKGDAFYQGSIFPQIWSLENYSKVLKETDFKIWVKNSMIVCFSVAILQLLMTTTAGYSFSRMKFKGRKTELLVLLILQMFPGIMTVSAILGVAYKLGFMDQLWALILVCAGGSAYNIWLFKGFIDGIPVSLDEAAMVDGASHWQIFSKIILPLSRSMLAVTFLFSFIGIYGEFVFTSALIKDNSLYTVAIGLQTFINNKFSTNWTQFSAASIMASLPIVIVFMFLQKFITKGLVAGALKE
ncbi:MAG: sugar ABC transporter permease [Caloramator sp.]|nr:sugar ABC transporter permease [Caloramator sp.]